MESWNHPPDPGLKLEKELLKLFIGILGHSIDLSQKKGRRARLFSSFFEASESLGSWAPIVPTCYNLSCLSEKNRADFLSAKS